MIQHAHVCLRCEAIYRFRDEPIEDEMLGLLTSLVGAQAQTAEEPPKSYIH